MSAQRLTLVQKFSLLSLLCVGLLSLALGLVTTRVLTRNMLDLEWQATADLVRYQVRAYSLERLFSDRALRSDRRRFGEALASLLSLPEVVRVKAWDGEGVVIWSDEERLIGRAFPGNPHLRAALGGAVSVKLKDLKSAENAYERERFTKLAEVYVPIVAAGSPGRVIGVLEVYKNPTRLFAQIRRVEVVIWSTSLAGGLVLYVSLFWIVWAADRNQRRLEERLRHSLVEVEAKKAQNAALDSFVYSVSHDLKAPLVAVQGMAGALAEDCAGQLDELGRHYVERLQANVEQMERLIQDLLTLSRVGRDGRTPGSVDLAEVVEDVLAEVGEPIRTRGIKVTVGELPELWAIRVQLEQVMRNLLGNAVKFIGDAATPAVEVGATRRPDGWECWVCDNGIGIDPAYHEKVFEIFQRLGEVEVDGTGVGLAIVKKIVDGAGGRVWVESAKGCGATFRFTWPAPAAAAR
ncbi:MAG: hypothetical protein HYU51_16480 [Candidatus Rokubacteria bacterium]|nr:hypothetical protein [Candidatus Rokubacteria bacterium]